MSNEPITTLKEAKEFFVEMNGSPYEMAREYPRRYEEYKQLDISKQTEIEWRLELLERHFDSIKKNADAAQIPMMYTTMYAVFRDLNTSKALEKMLEVAQYVRDKAPMKNRVIIAEYINGVFARSTRQGLIHKAYDFNNISAAKAFIDLSLHFSTYDGQDSFGIERCLKAAQVCQEIKAELGL